jgi:MFS family permease
MFLKKYGITSKNIILMYAIEFLGGFLFFLPVLALYFEQSLFSVKNVAIIFAIEAIAVAVFEIPTGALSDIFGRKKIVIIDFAATLIALTFLLAGGSMSMFIGYAIFNGLAMALASGNSQSLIYDSLKEENKEEYYKKVIGTLYAVWPLGAAVGSIIGGHFAHISLSAPVVYTFIPITIAFVLTFFLREPHYHKPENQKMFNHIGSSGRYILHSKQLIILTFGWLLLMSLGESMHLLKPIFLEFKEVPIVYFGYLFALIFGLSSISHYIGHDVSKKFGNKKTLMFCLVISPLLTLVATLTHKYTAAVLLAAPSLLFGIRNTIIDYLFNKNIPSSHRATINSINSFISKIGIAGLSPLIGYFADLYSINTAFMIGVGLMLLIPILFLFLKDDQ